MRAELRLTSSQFAQLRQHLLPDDAEHAAFVMCGVVRRPSGTLLLARAVVEVTDADLESTSESLHLDISPLSLARAAKRARNNGETLVVCHSHPFPGGVAASAIDLVTEEELCGRVLTSRLGQPSGALVLGPDGFDARLWLDDGPVQCDLRVDGRLLTNRKLPTRGPEDRDARQLLVWGHAGQALLRQAHVVVVGVGGTGSHVALQLGHLGVGKLTLVDPDVVEISNLSRLVGASASDVGHAKVDVLARAVRRLRSDTDVEAVRQSVLELPATPEFAAADLIMCCTDGHGSRALLTELAAQYMVTLIDLGVEVQAADASTRAGGGVRIVRPSGVCLHCLGVLDPALVRLEFLTSEERHVEAARGYLRGLDEPAPSVIALNGVVASLAVLEALNELLGVFDTAPTRLLYRAEARALTTAAGVGDDRCFVCGSTGLTGLGDDRPLPRRVTEPRLGSG